MNDVSTDEGVAEEVRQAFGIPKEQWDSMSVDDRYKEQIRQVLDVPKDIWDCMSMDEISCEEDRQVFNISKEQWDSMSVDERFAEKVKQIQLPGESLTFEQKSERISEKISAYKEEGIRKKIANHSEPKQQKPQAGMKPF